MAELLTTIVNGDLTITGGYKLVNTKPDNWDVKYAEYYKKENDEKFIKITKNADGSTPEFNSDNTYKLSDDGERAARMNDVTDLRNSINDEIKPTLDNLKNDFEEKIGELENTTIPDAYVSGLNTGEYSFKKIVDEDKDNIGLEFIPVSDSTDKDYSNWNSMYAKGDSTPSIKCYYSSYLPFMFKSKSVNTDNEINIADPSFILSNNGFLMRNENELQTVKLMSNWNNTFDSDTTINTSAFLLSDSDTSKLFLTPNSLKMIMSKDNSKSKINVMYNSGYYSLYNSNFTNEDGKEEEKSSAQLGPSFLNFSTGKNIKIQIMNNDDINRFIKVTGGYVEAQYFNATSDRRLKTNIVPYISEKSILDIPLYEFDYTRDHSHAVGIMAQDLQKDFPDMVQEDNSEEKYLSIKESKLVYLLMDECKKLRDRVYQLEKEVEWLRK